MDKQWEDQFDISMDRKRSYDREWDRVVKGCTIKEIADMLSKAEEAGYDFLRLEADSKAQVVSRAIEYSPDFKLWMQSLTFEGMMAMLADESISCSDLFAFSGDANSYLRKLKFVYTKRLLFEYVLFPKVEKNKSVKDRLMKFYDEYCLPPLGASTKSAAKTHNFIDKE